MIAAPKDRSVIVAPGSGSTTPGVFIFNRTLSRGRAAAQQQVMTVC